MQDKCSFLLKFTEGDVSCQKYKADTDSMDFHVGASHTCKKVSSSLSHFFHFLISFILSVTKPHVRMPVCLTKANNRLSDFYSQKKSINFINIK